MLVIYFWNCYAQKLIIRDFYDGYDTRTKNNPAWL